MEYAMGYLAVVVALQALVAIRAAEMEARSAFIISMVWPLTILTLILVLLVGAVGWTFEIKGARKFVGFRRPNDGWPGFAVTVCGIELLVWKKRQA